MDIWNAYAVFISLSRVLFRFAQDLVGLLANLLLRLTGSGAAKSTLGVLGVALEVAGLGMDSTVSGVRSDIESLNVGSISAPCSSSLL